jgi:next to BRCA1 gene 1 protein
VEHIDNFKQDINSTINLNQPPESCDRDSIVAEMTEAQDTAEPSVKNTTSNDEPTVDETKIPIIEPEATSVNGFNPSASPTVSYPLIDLSPTPAVADPSPSARLEVPIQPPTYKSEDLLLKELEEMGFKQINLNKEVLRLNKYDLEQSVEDLCGFSEWDPLLEELKEMVSNGRPQL